MLTFINSVRFIRNNFLSINIETFGKIIQVVQVKEFGDFSEVLRTRLNNFFFIFGPRSIDFWTPRRRSKVVVFQQSVSDIFHVTRHDARFTSHFFDHEVQREAQQTLNFAKRSCLWRLRWYSIFRRSLIFKCLFITVIKVECTLFMGHIFLYSFWVWLKNLNLMDRSF